MVYPQVKVGSYFILYSDRNTGVILNRDGSVNISKDQDYFSIFENLEKATGFAKELVSQSSDLEILIYDSSAQFIKVISLSD